MRKFGLVPLSGVFKVGRGLSKASSGRELRGIMVLALGRRGIGIREGGVGGSSAIWGGGGGLLEEGSESLGTGG